MSDEERQYDYVPGLAGVPAARSSICFIDGQKGKLQYRGYPVETLSAHCTFEEVAYLLLFGNLPTARELDQFSAELSAERRLKFRIVDMLKMLPESGHPMDALIAAIPVMSMFYPGDHVNDAAFRRACVVRILAKVPTIVAAWHRIRHGDEPILPNKDLGHAANFLYMVTGSEPDPLVARVLDVALILHMEHSMNASTFAARVSASTLTDPYNVIASAVGTLAGPLHGGANEEVLAMLRTIQSASPSAVRTWAEDKLARKDKIMGFGHREYKVKDPRAGILQGLAVQLFERFGRTPLYDIALELEKQMAELVGHKGVYPNVDFYSGLVYEKMNIPVDLFTTVFAIARTAGWLAHWLEQLKDNRIFRPSQVWTGQADRTFVPIADRQ